MALRILIVDDEPNILATVAPLLRSKGYTVLSAMTGRAALEAVDRDKPDLVVLDLGLPDLDGIDVCRQLRSDGWAGGVVMVSARRSPADRATAVGAGADVFLGKPFPLDDLVSAVDSLVGRAVP